MWGAPCAVVADRYRESEVLDVLAAAGIEAAWTPRGQGWRDGGEDLRDFAAAVADGEVAAEVSHLLRHSWSGAVTISDIAGNRKLARGAEGGRRSRHRDDPAAATILAVAEGRRLRRREQGAPPVEAAPWRVYPGAA